MEGLTELQHAILTFYLWSECVLGWSTLRTIHIINNTLAERWQKKGEGESNRILILIITTLSLLLYEHGPYVSATYIHSHFGELAKG